MKSKFEEEIKIIEDWDDDLIWCPSQCYLKFTYKGKHFVIYLRWRHTDPWTATLIEPQEKDWCLHENSKWHELKVPFFKDDELVIFVK
ncbi:MAG: hypothetical protein AAGH46_12395 [Bacteroidota bacterium]